MTDKEAKWFLCAGLIVTAIGVLTLAAWVLVIALGLMGVLA
jgi:hypothetical protein